MSNFLRLQVSSASCSSSSIHFVPTMCKASPLPQFVLSTAIPATVRPQRVCTDTQINQWKRKSGFSGFSLQPSLRLASGPLSSPPATQTHLAEKQDGPGVHLFSPLGKYQNGSQKPTVGWADRKALKPAVRSGWSAKGPAEAPPVLEACAVAARGDTLLWGAERAWGSPWRNHVPEGDSVCPSGELQLPGGGGVSERSRTGLERPGPSRLTGAGACAHPRGGQAAHRSEHPSAYVTLRACESVRTR